MKSKEISLLELWNSPNTPVLGPERHSSALASVPGRFVLWEKTLCEVDVCGDPFEGWVFLVHQFRELQTEVLLSSEARINSSGEWKTTSGSNFNGVMGMGNMLLSI